MRKEGTFEIMWRFWRRRFT